MNAATGARRDTHWAHYEGKPTLIKRKSAYEFSGDFNMHYLI